MDSLIELITEILGCGSRHVVPASHAQVARKLLDRAYQVAAKNDAEMVAELLDRWYLQAALNGKSEETHIFEKELVLGN
jgi:hypothetical protein